MVFSATVTLPPAFTVTDAGILPVKMPVASAPVSGLTK